MKQVLSTPPSVLSVILFLSAALSGCTDTDSALEPLLFSAPGSPEIGLRPPPALLSSRMIDQNQLYPIVNVSGMQVGMTREGNLWAGSFTLPQAGNNTLLINWFETFEGQELVLASASLQLTQSSVRELSINQYNSAQFDNDGDGFSNLFERENGMPPFIAATNNDGNGMVGDDDQDDTPDDNPPPVVVGNNQSDCRAPQRNVADFFPTAHDDNFNAEHLVIFDNYIAPFQINGSFDEQLILDGISDFSSTPAFVDSFNITVPGILTIEHESGEPSDSVIAIHDATLDEAIRVFAENDDRVNQNDGTTNFRAGVSVDVEPGIYCFAITPFSFFNTSGAQLGSPQAVLRINFAAR